MYMYEVLTCSKSSQLCCTLPESFISASLSNTLRSAVCFLASSKSDYKTNWIFYTLYIYIYIHYIYIYIYIRYIYIYIHYIYIYIYIVYKRSNLFYSHFCLKPESTLLVLFVTCVLLTASLGMSLLTFLLVDLYLRTKADLYSLMQCSWVVGKPLQSRNSRKFTPNGMKLGLLRL